MKTIIVFATKYGCTEKCSNMLASKLAGDIKVLNIKNSPVADLSEYDTVILGGSIIAGRINSRLKRFYEDNMDLLLQKKTGLFVCAGMEEKAEKELKDNFPEKLIKHSIATGYFGYEFSLEKMSFAVRILVKKMVKVNESISKISEESIDKFVEEILK